MDDGVVPLANALVDVLAILQQHAEFMGDYSTDTKGLAWFVSILADYYFRDRQTKRVVYELPLRDGEMYTMRGPEFQKKVTHEIPKAVGVSRRVSITLRKHDAPPISDHVTGSKRARQA